MRINKKIIIGLSLIYLLFMSGCMTTNTSTQEKSKTATYIKGEYDCINAHEITFLEVMNTYDNCKETCETFHCNDYEGLRYSSRASGKLIEDSYGRLDYISTCDCHCRGKNTDNNGEECIYRTWKNMGDYEMPIPLFSEIR